MKEKVFREMLKGSRFFRGMRLGIMSARPISGGASPFHELQGCLGQSSGVPMGSEEVEAKPFFMMLGSWTNCNIVQSD